MGNARIEQIMGILGENMTEIKHGIGYFIRTGEFHPSIRSRKKLKKDLEILREELMQNIPDMNIQKELLLNETIKCVGVLWLANLYMNKTGIFKERELQKGLLELQPFLGKGGLISYLNTLRLNLISLNLESKKADEALDLKAYVKEKYGKEKK